MEQVISDLFEEMLNQDLISIVISNSEDKEKISKITIRPVILKTKGYYQIEEFRGNQVFHHNYKKEEILKKLPEWFCGLMHQAELKSGRVFAIMLISKKGKVTIKRKKISEQLSNLEFSHNRKKQYLIEEGKPVPFLIELGVMTKDGEIVKAKYDKFRQINRYLEFIDDILPELPKERKIEIIDFGCGKSYLTFALYYFLKEQKGMKIHITGLDLKKDVIEQCTKLAEQLGYHDLEFIQGEIGEYQKREKVDMVISLHACDTATDYALWKAVLWDASVILSVPCCQHELNAQMENEVLQPILKYGLIKERIAALVTDALRADLLKDMGYQTQILEFIDMEHTPKNILIRAVKNKTKSILLERIKIREETLRCMNALNVKPMLWKLLTDTGREEKAQKEKQK